MAEAARFILQNVSSGLQAHMEDKWMLDDNKTISDLAALYPNSIDIQVVNAMGRAYPTVCRGQALALDILFENDQLNRFYRHGLGFQEGNSILADFVNTLTRSSGKMRILEIGAGTGSVTESILPSRRYSSYVFTDVSSAFLGPAQKKFNQYCDCMTFQTFDIGRDPVKQGLQLGSFDIVVAANVIHAVEDVKGALARIRSLLRPGGYLACLELSEKQPVRNSVIFGGLSGWWVGHGKDRSLSPALRESQWNQYLRDTGFSGIDLITPSLDELLVASRVFYTQAIDDRVLILRTPLSARAPKPDQSLMILGGADLQNGNLVKAIMYLLSPRFREIFWISSIGQITDTTVPHVVLSLLELEAPIFRDMTAEKWAGLQRLFDKATDVLWVTTDLVCPKDIDAVNASMMVGLARTVRHELQHLRLQTLDVGQGPSVTAGYLSEALLRWYILGKWLAEGWQDQVLFPHHTELFLKDGVLSASMVEHCKMANDRYNSQHRCITQDMKPHGLPVGLVYDPAKSSLHFQQMPEQMAHISEETITVKVLYNTLYAFNIKGLGFKFLGLGVLADRTHVFMLMESICSLIRLPRSAVFSLPFASRIPIQHQLHAIVAKLVANRVLTATRPKGSLAVICADARWISSIQHEAARCGKSVTFITSDKTLEVKGATFIHHDDLDVVVRRKLPEDISTLVSISNRPDDGILLERVKTTLRTTQMKVKDSAAFFQRQSFVPAGSVVSEKTSRAVAALVAEAASGLNKDSYNAPIARPLEVVHHTPQSPAVVLDWTAQSQVPVTVQPAARHVRFDPRRAYMIIGSSDIARSVCEWMITSGARFVAMISRDANHLAEWAQEMLGKGAAVKPISADVTDEASIGEALDIIKSTNQENSTRFPPFGGVMHLGLVLKDGVFSTMSFKDLQAVLDVKAKGSLILHKALAQEPLDFFIMTSSFSCAIGNPGQANYNCGNAYMVGLAKYRRSIGLPASVIHLGAVVGLGYISRAANAKSGGLLPEDIRKKAYPISERDLHQIFAEAVLASPADSGAEPEIVTGFKDIGPEMLEQYPWISEPMFAHMRTKATSAAVESSSTQLSLRELLCEAISGEETAATSSEDGALGVVHSALLNRLKVLLQMDEIDDNARIIDLGIDSLVASEISSWARKELHAQVPASFIVGGASVKELTLFALKELDRKWVLELKNA